jgi:conjugative transfer pilus assembly protein TraH
MKKLIVLWFLLAIPAMANIGQDLMRFFQQAGIASNVSDPGYYKDQTAGYYTGGSLVTRNRTRNTQLASLQIPGYRAGCGGIDLWTGGFSHISSQQLVEMLRSIGSSAASYAFMLAIQTVSPQIYNLLNELNSLATQINQNNINSCEIGATLLGGVWPKSDQASQHLCQAMGTQLGSFADWAAARHGCGARGDRSRVLWRKNTDPRYREMLIGDFNLAWKAIQSNHFLSQDRELAQLFMTLVGSIIVRHEGEALAVHVLPGYADHEEVIQGLLQGGESLLYQCDSDACLNPQLQRIRLHQPSSLLQQVQTILNSLINKIYADEAVTPAEKDFLNSTRLPIYKVLNVITAYRRGSAPLDIHQYEELIALDILYRYVLEVVDLVQESVQQLKSVQVEASQIEQFLRQLSEARVKIVNRRQSAFQQMDNTLSLIQATQLIEKQLHIALSNVANETNAM